MTRATFLVAAWMLASVVTDVPAQTGWTLRTPATLPGARGWHVLTYDIARNTSVLFGGHNNGWLGDTWEWSGSTWTPRSLAHVPSPRGCCGFGFDLPRARVVLFGGQGPTSDLNDTWEYDGVDWTEIVTAQAPSPRRLPGFAFDLTRGALLLFGGGNGSGMQGGMWQWTGANWIQLQPATLPPLRWGFGMVADFARARIVLHGGSNTFGGQPATFRDTWIWDGTNWTLLPTTVAPPPVLSFGMTYDWVRSTPVLFGGDPLSDQTWLLAGDTWVRDPTPLAPQNRWANMITFDLQSGRTLMFGGWTGLSTSLGDTWEYVAPALATWTSFGAGCAGSVGVPRLQSVANARPVLGTTFPIELLNVPGALAAMTIGFSATAWSGGTLPASLASLGMPGCTLFASPEFPFTTPATAGHATLSWPLPNVAAFAGIQFFVQGIALDPGTNPLGAVVSNACAGVIGAL